MTSIAVLDDWQGAARHHADWSVLAPAQITFFTTAFASQDDAVSTLAAFDILITTRERTPLPASLIELLPRLRMLGITGTRNNSLDLATCTRRGVVVCNTTGANAGQAAAAELALGLLLATARRIPAGDASIRAGGFQASVPVGMALAGKTLGIVGLGRLGRLMAAYCTALGMKVIAWSPHLTAETAAAAGAERVSKDDLFSRADAVSLHLVLAPSTRHIVGRYEIGLMKPGAILINTSRGPLVDEDSLVEALEANRIAAGLDVFDSEPLGPRDRMRGLPNAVLTPHLGFCVTETFDSFYGQSVENAAAFLRGAPIRVMNPEVLVPL